MGEHVPGSGFQGAAPGPIEPVPSRRRRVLVVVLAALVLGGSVAVGLVIASGGSGGREPGVTPSTVASPEPTPPAPIPPPQVSVRSKTATRVVLEWEPAPDGVEVTEYLVYRAQNLAAKVEGTRTAFADVGLNPNQLYTYHVVGRGPAGDSEGPEISVRTVRPSLGKARVDGPWRLRGTVVDEYNFVGVDEGDEIKRLQYFELTSPCQTGACKQLKVLFRIYDDGKVLSTIRGTVHREGRFYTGRFEGPYISSCRGASISGAWIEVRFEVVRAKGYLGEWRATRITGTYERFSPRTSYPSAGCLEAYYELEMVGVLDESWV